MLSSLFRRSISSLLPKRVKIVEVGPRDGLQNEPITDRLTVEVKARLIKDLAACGLPTIEAGSFVSARWVPQMAGTAQVLQAVQSLPCNLPVLVPNVKGMEEAIAHKVKEVAVFTAASETFCQKNTNCTIVESIDRIAKITAMAKAEGIRVRGYISCVVGCPYEGNGVPREKVLEVCQELLHLGCYEVSLGDTIGVGTAGNIQQLLDLLLGRVSASKLALHCHDTYGQALTNVLVGLQNGIATIDSSVAGLGGCPYAPGATGNLATEDLVYLLHGMGIETGVDLDHLVLVGEWICQQLGRENKSRAARALLSKRSK